MRRLEEREWTTNVGLSAVVLMLNTGFPHRCGYVRVPDDFNSYEKSYDELHAVNVHGGLTYAGEVMGKGNGFWFGFDAMHYNDAPDWEAGEKMCETDKERQLLNDLRDMESSMFNGCEVRTLEYMMEECESLAIQLVAMNIKGELV